VIKLFPDFIPHSLSFLTSSHVNTAHQFSVRIIVIAYPSQCQSQCRQESRFEAASNVYYVPFHWQSFGITRILRSLSLLCCIAALWGMSSCNDAPGPIGSELIPGDTLNLKTITNDSLPLIVASTIGQNIARMNTDLGFTSANTPFFIGAARTLDGDEFSATALVRYQLPVRSDSIRMANFMSLTENDIIDVRLFMRPSSFLLGDTITKVLPFRVYELRQRWYNDSINRTNNPPLPQTLVSSPFIASYSLRSITFRGETLTDAGPILTNKQPLLIRDKAMIVRWIQSDSSTWFNNVFGLAFVPLLRPNTPFAQTMFGFEGASYIVVRYQRPQDTTQNFLTISEDAQVTLTSGPVPNNPNNNEIMVQGGLALRSSLDFDIRTIPALSTIHQAELILPVDTVRSLISTRGYPQTLQLHFSLPDNRFVINTTTGASLTVTGFLDATSGTTRYIFSSGTNSAPNMIAAIQRLVKFGGLGQLVLHLTPQIVTSSGVFRSDEEQTLHRIIFRRLRGSGDPMLRPRLTITYSLRPR
jgi:hypothetical protein